MIRIIIIVVAFLVLLLGGAVGLVYKKIIPDPTGGMIVPTVKTVTETIAKELPGANDPVYMDIPPVTIPVYEEGRVKYNVYIAFRLEMERDKNDIVDTHQLQLRDVYLRGLTRLIGVEMTQRRTPDVAAIKNYLKELTLKIVGPGIFKDVLIVQLYMR